MDRYTEFVAYDPDRWEHTLYCKASGGYVVTERERIRQSQLNKQEKEKFNKELSMCLTLALNGYRVEYLKISENSYDIHLDGVAADLKKTKSHNNLVEYAKHAVHQQKAKLVIFEFSTMTGRIHDELNKLKRLGIPVKYYITSDLPEIIDL